MIPTAVPAYYEPTAVLAVILIFLIPLATAGVALIHTGLSRSRSAAHTMLASLSIAAVAGIAYGVCGFAWQGAAGHPGHAILVAGKAWSWIGNESFFLRSLTVSGPPAAMVACFGVFAAGLCALIPLGAGADRWRLGAALASAVFVAGIVFPLFAHWTWAGWLRDLGNLYGLGSGYVDLAGAGAIHALGGMSALALCWTLGPRRSKYTLDGMPLALPGHNTVLVLAGCLLAWTGWLGLNGAGALLFGGLSASALPLVVIDTTFAAAAAALTAAAVTRIRFRRPDASLCANGWVGGLVASSGACAFFTPFTAVFVGAIAGLLIPLSVEWLDIYLEFRRPRRRHFRIRRGRRMGHAGDGPPGRYPGHWQRSVLGPTRGRLDAPRFRPAGLLRLASAPQSRVSPTRFRRRRTPRHGPARTGRRRVP